jgi:hypothetical protein
MALSLKFTFTLTNNSKTLAALDSTGVYSSTNLGGYNTPNPARNTVTLVLLYRTIGTNNKYTTVDLTYHSDAYSDTIISELSLDVYELIFFEYLNSSTTISTTIATLRSQNDNYTGYTTLLANSLILAQTKYIFINDVNIKSCLETVNKNICDKIMDGIQFDSEEYIHLASLYSGMYVTSGKNDLENTKKIFDALTANCQNCLDCLC